ncbi:MAG: hypothetical protein OXG26_09780 [Caldilineaceae bacterium]|nr:hypothetical protein [Caldilineaceae bacterium]
MGSQKPNQTPWILTIVLAIIGIFSIPLAIPFTNPFASPPTPIPAPSPTSIPTPTLIPTSTPQWNNWPETAKQIPYKELFRYAESHVGEKIYFRAKIIQATEKDGDFTLRAHVTPINDIIWEDAVILIYNNAPIRVLKDDIVHFVGIMEGIHTYGGSLGYGNTVPSITVLKLIIE